LFAPFVNPNSSRRRPEKIHATERDSGDRHLYPTNLRAIADEVIE
jgi:hypothetical protein